MEKSDETGMDMDADLDEPPRRSWLGSFLKGVVTGAVLCSLGAVAAFVILPPPGHLPSGETTEVIQSQPSSPEPPTQPVAEPEPSPAPAPAPSPETTATAPAENATPNDTAPTEGVAPVEPSSTPVAEPVSPATEPESPAPAPATGDEPEAAPAPEAAAPAEIRLSGPAIEVNAQPVEVPARTPLLSVIVSDAGSGGITPEVLLDLQSTPLTLAIQPDAQAEMLGTAARASGHEVLVQLPMGTEDATGTKVGLSPGMASAAVEELAVRSLAGLNMAVGAVGVPGASASRDADIIYSLRNTLQPHGFVFVDLRTLPTETAGTGDETSPYLRADAIVTKISDATELSQSLDAAARMARRKGSHVLVLPSDPAVLQGLLSWRLASSESQGVQLVPVSAVLRRRQVTQPATQ